MAEAAVAYTDEHIDACERILNDHLVTLAGFSMPDEDVTEAWREW